MDFDFTSEQILLRDSVERYVRTEYAFERRRGIAASAAGWSRDHWRAFAELGWLGITIPEAYGGFGGTPVETMILMEAFGRGLVLEPYLPTAILGAGLLDRAGSAEQRAHWLPAIVGGERRLAFGFAEPRSRYRLAEVGCTAERGGSGWRLDGVKVAVVGAGAADALIISARTAGGRRDAAGISLFLVDAGRPGIERRDARALDGTRLSEVRLTAVEVPASARLGAEGEGFDLIERVVDHAIAAVCADAVGAMQAVYEITREHLGTRRQFGRPIGSFQVLQHRMVDMFIRLEQARSLTYLATLELGRDRDARRRAVSCAKAYIGEAARFVGSQAVQLHGGMGMTDELGVSHYYKHLMTADILFGNAAHHLRQYAALTQ